VIIDFPILPAQPAVFTSSDNQVCQNQSGVTYSVTNDVSVTYTWNYSGTGVTINGSGNSINLDYDATATNGTLSVTTTNGCGTSSALTLDITVNTQATINLGANPEVCLGSSSASLPYTSTTGSPDKYSIVYDAGALAAGFVSVTNSNLSNPVSLTVPIAAVVNVYDADLSVRNSTTGCISGDYAITVTINPLPVVTITGSTLECEGVSSTLDAGPGYTSYSWNFGATAMGNSQTQTITTQSLATPTNTVTETYTVVVTNIEGCSGTDTHNISVYRLPDTGPAYFIPNSFSE
jgi:hypothetical protein